MPAMPNPAARLFRVSAATTVQRVLRGCLVYSDSLSASIYRTTTDKVAPETHQALAAICLAPDKWSIPDPEEFNASTSTLKLLKI